MQVRRWLAELAWLPGMGHAAGSRLQGAHAAGSRLQGAHAAGSRLQGALRRDVLIEASGERFTVVEPDVPVGDATRLRGLTLPGLANAHSHAFHRALRGITQADKGTFWTWRERMYQVAARLDPDSYFRLARAVYAEMTLAGVTCVGEFHYLHHQPGGMSYSDPNAMGQALVAAAAEAGLRITLLDTCYLAGGLERDGLVPLSGLQLRFGDGDGAGWAGRMSSHRFDEHGMISAGARLGAAIHSVRAVPPEQMGPVVAWARRYGAPLHVHLSEQLAENEACVAVYGVSPARLLYDEEALGPRTSVVHATHVSAGDVRLLGGVQAFACICPTTERDLGDGLAPASELMAAGCRLTLGSDSHAVIDMFEEARGVEYAERLARQARGIFAAPSLMGALTSDGHTSLGWPEAGQIEPGAWADLITVSLGSVRTAGTSGGDYAVEAAVFAATAADVSDVVISGRDVVRDGVHLHVPDVAGELSAAIGELR